MGPARSSDWQWLTSSWTMDWTKPVAIPITVWSWKMLLTCSAIFKRKSSHVRRLCATPRFTAFPRYVAGTNVVEPLGGRRVWTLAGRAICRPCGRPRCTWDEIFQPNRNNFPPELPPSALQAPTRHRPGKTAQRGVIRWRRYAATVLSPAFPRATCIVKAYNSPGSTCSA
jgi:hypothetical protein